MEQLKKPASNAIEIDAISSDYCRRLIERLIVEERSLNRRKKQFNKEVAEEIRGEVSSVRRISDYLFYRIVNKILLLSDSYRQSQPEELLGAVVTAVEDDLKANPLAKDREGKMDKDELSGLFDIVKAEKHKLSPEAQEAFNRIEEELLIRIIRTSSPTKWRDLVSKTQHKSIELPTVAPLLWSQRKTFHVEDIADPLLKARLETDPALVDRIRSFEKGNALEFLDIIYGEYIQHGFGQKELRYKIDKRLWDLCGEQARNQDEDLSKYLPTLSMQIDKTLRSSICQVE